MAPFLTIEELEARQTEIRGRLDELHTQHKGQAFPKDSETEWNALNSERDDNQRTIEQLRTREERIKELGEKPEHREEGVSFQAARPGVTRGGDIYDLSTIRTAVNDPDAAALEMRDRAMRSVETAQFPHERANAKREDVQAHIERLLKTRDTEDGQLARHLLATGSPIYRRAFAKAIVGRPLSDQEQRAMSLTGASGGFAVPYTLDPTIIPTSNSSINPWRAISRQETLVGSNEWRGVSSQGITATRVAEATEGTDANPVLAQPSAVVTKAHVTIPFSIEIGQDWGGLESEMARMIQDAKDDEEATAFATGAGTGVNPQGIITGATNLVNAAAGATITAKNLYDLEAALPPRFRPNEVFVANRGIYNVVRSIDTGGGATLWLYLAEGLNNQVPSPGNTGALLLGRPAYESSAMASTVALNAKVMVVGDFRYFLIVDRIGLTVEVVPHLMGATNRLPTGQRAIYAYWRNTSKVLDPNAFRVLNGQT